MVKFFNLSLRDSLETVSIRVLFTNTRMRWRLNEREILLMHEEKLSTLYHKQVRVFVNKPLTSVSNP